MPGQNISGAMTPTALGLRAHSGWAGLVAVAGPSGLPGSPPAPVAPPTPIVIDRRRIEFADPEIPGSKQPYHAAAELDLKGAASFLGRCRDRAKLLAQQALRVVINELRERGYGVVGCGVLLGSGRTGKTLAETLASHALIHAAEGDLFRDVVIHGSEDCGLPVTGVRERELFARGASELGTPADKLERFVTEMGRAIGPPWRQDEKYAALVAWLALAARSR